MPTASSCCDHCGERPATGQRLLRCSACLSAYYCSQTCQAAAWRAAHKKDCKHMALEALRELMRRSGVGGRLVLPNPDSAVVRRPNPTVSSKEVVDRALALSWTLRDEGYYERWHVAVLRARVTLELDGQCDVEARRRVIRLVNRALTTLEWPSITESHSNWVAFLELSAQLIDLGGRDEGLAIWSRQLEGIEARAPPTVASGTLLTYCKLLVEKALDGAEKMDDEYVRNPNVLSAETKAALARAAALLPAATSSDLQTLESLTVKLHACQAKDIGVPFARRRLELSPPGRKVVSYFFLADFLRGAYRLREADDAAKEGLALANLSQADRLSLLMVRSGIMRTMGRLPEALALAKEGHSIAQAQGLDSVTATLKVADLLDRMGQVEEAKVYDAMLVERGMPVGGYRFPNIARILASYGITDLPPDEARRLEAWLVNLSQDRNKHIGPFYRFARYWADTWGQYFFEDLFRTLSLCGEGIEVSNLTEGPELPRKIKELFIETLRHTGTPEALREAQVVADEVARMKEAEEANWRVALEETRAAIAAEAIVRREGGGRGAERGGGGGGQGTGGGSKKKKSKKGKKKRGKAGATARLEGQDASLVGALGALEIEDTSGADAMAAEGGGAAEVHQEEEEVQEEEPEECSICIEPLAREDEERGDGHVRTLDCGHAFHEHCMDLWFGKCAEKGIEPTCPYCRHPIRE